MVGLYTGLAGWGLGSGTALDKAETRVGGCQHFSRGGDAPFKAVTGNSVLSHPIEFGEAERRPGM